MLIRSALLCLFLSACTELPMDRLYQCNPDRTCPANLECNAASVCVPKSDVGGDAGLTDAGARDAGVPDAGARDAGAPDAGGPDAGVPDAGFVCPTTCPTDGGCFTDQRCAPLRCGCRVGLTCDNTSNSCELPKVCTNDWCYEYPLPQGHHLYAAHAEPNYFVWGGERGVLFEWDGFDTRFVPLSDATGDILDFAGKRDAGLLLGTSTGGVFSLQPDGGWARAIPPLTDAGVTCHSLQASFFDVLLGCSLIEPTDAGLTAVVLSAPYGAFAQGFTLTRLPATDAGVLNQVDALTTIVVDGGTEPDGGARLALLDIAFARRTRGTTEVLHRRALGPWQVVRAVTDTNQTPLSSAISPSRGITKTHVGILVGGGETSGFVATTEDGVLWPFLEQPKPLETIGPGTRGAVVGGLDYLAEVYDDDTVTALDPPHGQQRRWFATATSGTTTLAVGAFGATAVFERRNCQPTVGGEVCAGALHSSRFAMNATDLCGTTDGGAMFLTFSGAAMPDAGLQARPDDLLTLDAPQNQNDFAGVMRRTGKGAWHQEAWDQAMPWNQAIDQCHVDDASGLHYLAGSQFVSVRNGVVRSTPLPPSVPQGPGPDAGFAAPLRYLNLWASPTSAVVTSAAGVPIVVRNGVATFPDGGISLRPDGGQIVLVASDATGCVPFGFDDDLWCVTNRMWLSVPNMSHWQTTNENVFASQLHGRRIGTSRSLWTVRTIGAQTETYKQTNCPIAAVNCAAGFERQTVVSEPAGARAYRVWVDVDGTPIWLAGTFPVNFVPDAKSTFQVVRPTATGRDTRPVPAWFITGDTRTSRLTLWGDDDELFLQWNRGVISRRKDF